MKKKTTKNIIRYKANELPEDTKTDWARVDAMTDQQAKKNAQLDKDTLWADEKFWQVAQLLMPAVEGKERITFRIDADILKWLRQQGKGYQSRMNSILRGFMIASQDHFDHPRKKSPNKKPEDKHTHQ